MNTKTVGSLIDDVMKQHTGPELQIRSPIIVPFATKRSPSRNSLSMHNSAMDGGTKKRARTSPKLMKKRKQSTANVYLTDYYKIALTAAKVTQRVPWLQQTILRSHR